VFAWIPLNDAGWLGRGPRIAVKLPADLVTELRHTYPGQVGPARPPGQQYWATIPLTGNIPDSEICELLTLSYHEVVARLPQNRRPTGHPRPS
jgi:predicted DNA-binding protein (MmcQ/YjbR family)